MVHVWLIFKVSCFLVSELSMQFLEPVLFFVDELINSLDHLPLSNLILDFGVFCTLSDFGVIVLFFHKRVEIFIKVFLFI